MELEFWFGEEELAGGVEGEVAGFFAAGGRVAEKSERAIRGINGEDGDGIMSAVGGEEPFARWMEGDFSGVVAAGKTTWQHRNDLLGLECFRVVGKNGDRGR